MRSAGPINGLYAITPEFEEATHLYRLVEQALRGGTTMLQYREKNLKASDRLERAAQLRALCERHGALFIINDDVALAAQVNAHGVHLGREDMSIAQARALLGPQAIVGVSCYDQLQRAHEAAAQGADYVAFGSMFVSQVKPSAVRAPLSLIHQARQALTTPIVAIGGIDLDNATSVLRAGAHALAVITALFSAPDVQGRARAFADLISNIQSHCSAT